jgi:hypothetical protein
MAHCWLALCTALLLAAPSLARAITLVPLTMTPVSVTVSSGTLGLPSVPGAASGSASGSYSVGGWQGQATFTATVSGDRIDFVMSGDASQAPPADPLYLSPQATVVVDVAIPNVGGPLTPIFWDVIDLDFTSTTFTFGCAAASSEPRAASTVAGGRLEIPSSPAEVCIPPDPAGSSVGWSVLPAGDTIRLEFTIWPNAASAVQQPGSFAGSFGVRLRASAPTIGTADVNGDSVVDVLDVTLIRRGLAGLPPFP